ncbi:hypothetical protein JCM39194_23540 [Desulfotomaculum varum]
MDAAIVQEILQQAPFGYAYHKVVLNQEGLPEDYIFLDVNPVFEAILLNGQPPVYCPKKKLSRKSRWQITPVGLSG